MKFVILSSVFTIVFFIFYHFPKNDDLSEDLHLRFSTIEDVCTFVSIIITYKKDSEIYGVPDYWQSPEETLNLKTGDCEDYCLLVLKLCQESNLGRPHLVYLPALEHGVVYHNGKVYEPQSYRGRVSYFLSDFVIFSYDEAILLMLNNKLKYYAYKVSSL